MSKARVLIVLRDVTGLLLMLMLMFMYILKPLHLVYAVEAWVMADEL